MLQSEELNYLGKRILTVLKSLLLVCHCFTLSRFSAKFLNPLRIDGKDIAVHLAVIC